MKKTVIIFSFLIITVLSVGSFFIHMCYMHSYKKEFRAFISNQQYKKNYTVIQINPSQLFTNSKSVQWLDENKEIVFKNNLYDIVSIKYSGTSVTLILVSDEQELILKQQFADLFDVEALQQTKIPLKILKKILELKGVCNVFNYNITNNENADNYFLNYTYFIHQVCISIKSPPPNL